MTGHFPKIKVIIYDKEAWPLFAREYDDVRDYDDLLDVSCYVVALMRTVPFAHAGYLIGDGLCRLRYEWIGDDLRCIPE